MSPEEIRRQITNQLDDVERQVEENFAALGQLDEAFKRQFLRWASAQPLRGAITDYMARPESTTGFHTLALFAWWRDELTVLTAKFTASSIATSIKVAWSSLTGILQPLLTAINQGLWTLLSSLLTVKEWSLTGGVGAGVLGLTGNVAIEITFT